MFAQVFIAGGVLYLLNIVHQEQIHLLAGFKNLTGRFSVAIHEDMKEVWLFASVRNLGLVPQKIQRLESDKDIIQFFFGNECSGWVVQPRSSKSFSIGPSKIEKLERADNLFLANNMEKLHIASKKEIQETLKRYREYIKKGAKHSPRNKDSIVITKWCNE